VSGRFSVSERLASFGHAFRGLAFLLRDEHNARIHFAASLGVVVTALALGVSRDDWVSLLIAMALVWLAEALNSALEYLCDVAHPEPHPLIGKAKDVAAAGVLLVALAAVVIGVLVFLPYLMA
jgi:diacylglycerol kinase (ATP)